MSRVFGALVLGIALSGCGSYVATSGTRFSHPEAAVRASAKHDLHCTGSLRVVQSGFRSGRVSSGYWRVAGCGREAVYREASGGFSVWQIVIERPDGREP